MHQRALDILLIILWQLFKCIWAFYSGSYLGASISHGAYQLNEFSIIAPFDFKTWVAVEDCCTYSKQTKINLLSMLGGYIFLFSVLVISVRKAHWLFILLMDILHVIISCIVMQSFPLNASYWICLGIASFVCLASADIIVFFINEKKPSKVQPVPNLVSS